MPHLPARFAEIILAFAPLFVHRTWRHARVLLAGAIPAPGRRTVTSVLRITGRSRERRFVNYHRVLSRAAWDPRAGARTLLGLLVAAFAPRGPVIPAVDDTIERRWGRRVRPSAWLGSLAGVGTAGGKPRLLGITKRANAYLRTLLVHGARAALPSLSASATALGEWLRSLIGRTHKNNVVVALAGKLARSAWAVLRSGEGYASRMNRPATA